MMKLYSRMPSLDLHEMDRVYARILIEEFIQDQIHMKNKEFLIIHGIGTGVLRKETQEVLKRNPYVEEYKIDYFNPGCTIVKLR